MKAFIITLLHSPNLPATCPRLDAQRMVHRTPHWDAIGMHVAACSSSVAFPDVRVVDAGMAGL